MHRDTNANRCFSNPAVHMKYIDVFIYHRKMFILISDVKYREVQLS